MTKRICCIAAALLIMVSLVGCGKAEKLVGTWETEIDISGIVREALVNELGEEGAGKFRVEQLMLTMMLTFEKDGTYHMTLDKESVDAAGETLIRQMKEGFMDYMELYLKENGYESLDKLLAAANITDEEFERTMDEQLAGMSDELNVENLVGDSVSSGSYAVTGGKLYMTKEGEDIAEAEPCEDFRVTEDTLTLIDGEETVFTKKTEDSETVAAE